MQSENKQILVDDVYVNYEFLLVNTLHNPVAMNPIKLNSRLL